MKTTADAVLLDDDMLVHQVWSMLAKKNNKVLISYQDVDKFLAEINNYDFQTPLYIDSNLGKGIQGEVIAKKAYDMGFQNIYIASGMPSSNFSHLTFIKGVTGKDAPWK